MYRGGGELMATVREVLEANFEENGGAIYAAAKALGIEMGLNEEGRLDIADVAALIDHESPGGLNIFGWDWGEEYKDEVPFAHLPVTKGRVEALLAYTDERGTSNGVGPAQLTYPPLIKRAQERGGADIPYHNIYVGVELLQELVGKLGYTLGIAAYNAGEGNAQLGINNGYFAKVMHSRAKWKELLRDATDGGQKDVAEEYPTIVVYKDAAQWLRSKEDDRYVRLEGLPNAEVHSDADKWLWTPAEPGIVVPDPVPDPVPAPEPTQWEWPVANNPPGWIGDGSYEDLYPTRYFWREDVEVVARYLWDQYGAWCNTYHMHPPVFGHLYETVSMDVWGSRGRGDPLPLEVGWAIYTDIFGNGLEPWIRWVIWQGRIWDPWNGDQAYWETDVWSDGGHYNHIHYTFI